MGPVIRVHKWRSIETGLFREQILLKCEDPSPQVNHGIFFRRGTGGHVKMTHCPTGVPAGTGKSNLLSRQMPMPAGAQRNVHGFGVSSLRQFSKVSHGEYLQKSEAV
jgi:hypothetical protein